MAERRTERPAPLILVVEPAAAPPGDGSYGALAARGQTLLAAELSRRFTAVGAEVQRLSARADTPSFHWGSWFASAARIARLEARTAGKPGEAIGYAGAGALALLDERGLAALAAARPGEVVANNRFSADAFVVAGDVDGALNVLANCATDNAAVRELESAGFVSRDLSAERWSRFDVDTPLDLALLRLATRLPGTRVLDGVVAAFLENVTGPGGHALEVPELDRIGAVVRDRDAGAGGRRSRAVERVGIPGERVRLPGALLCRGARHALGSRARSALDAGGLGPAAWRGRPRRTAGRPG